jgi:hypothetical protein
MGKFWDKISEEKEDDRLANVCDPEQARFANINNPVHTRKLYNYAGDFIGAFTCDCSIGRDHTEG